MRGCKLHLLFYAESEQAIPDPDNHDAGNYSDQQRANDPGSDQQIESEQRDECQEGDQPG